MRHFAKVAETINIWLAAATICGSAVAWRVFALSGSGVIDALLVLFCLTVASLGAYSTAGAWRRSGAATTDPPEERGGDLA
jgi:hypothetical protein